MAHASEGPHEKTVGLDRNGFGIVLHSGFVVEAVGEKFREIHAEDGVEVDVDEARED